MDQVERRVRRLVCLYPRSWRQRYGEEMTAVLNEQMAESGSSLRLRADVVREAGHERLRDVGLRLGGSDPADRVRAGTALVYSCLVVFVGLACGLVSQLRTGLTETRASGGLAPVVVRLCSELLSGLLVLALVVCCLAAARGSIGVIRAVRTTQTKGLLGPGLLFVGGLGTLSIVGWTADRAHWFTPAGAALPHGGGAELATLWIRGVVAPITPAWVHPLLFGHMPAGELIAVLLAPLGCLAMAFGLARLALRLPDSSTAQSSRVAMARGVVTVMAVFVIVCIRWLAAQTRPGAGHADFLVPGHTAVGVLMVLGALTALAAVGAHGMRPPRRRAIAKAGNQQ
jgi:hypothetical protein